MNIGVEFRIIETFVFEINFKALNAQNPPDPANMRTIKNLSRYPGRTERDTF